MKGRGRHTHEQTPLRPAHARTGPARAQEAPLAAAHHGQPPREARDGKPRGADVQTDLNSTISKVAESHVTQSLRQSIWGVLSCPPEVGTEAALTAQEVKLRLELIAR